MANSISAMQAKKGNKLLKSLEGLKKLTVSMKVVDAIWGDIITSYKEFKRLPGALAMAKAALPSVEEAAGEEE